jgi:Methyltransferase FkbM domain
VDGGVYNAYYALAFAKLSRQPVVAYEPDPVALARSRRNLALNPTLAPLIELRAVALGARPAKRVATLDAELLPGIEQVRPTAWLLKIDVEGAELDVLSGAAGVLELIHPHVIIETHSGGLEDACGEALLAAGYSPRIVTQRRLLPQDRSWPPGTPRHNRWLVAVGRQGPTSA